MPELPEVETVMRGMAKAINGKTLKRVEVYSPRLRQPIPPALAQLHDEKVTTLRRRAKYIIVPFKSGRALVLHLGMTGRVTIDPQEKEKHDHFKMVFSGGTEIVFNDARRFGLVDVTDEAHLARHRFFAHLGPEPFDAAFDAAYLLSQLQGRRTAVKVALMDQELVVGVGNIYAAEALFRARISPLRAGGDITRAEAKKIIAAVHAVLEQSIAAGGSSLRDYVQADGELGYFQDEWKVYGRACEKCLHRGCPGHIARITQGGRSTFYCPDCQI